MTIVWLHNTENKFDSVFSEMQITSTTVETVDTGAELEIIETPETAIDETTTTQE